MIPLMILLTLSSFYLSEGFLHLQNAVGLAIIEYTAQTNISLKIAVEVSEKRPISV